MNSQWKLYSARFNELSLRERVLMLGGIIALILFVWWIYYSAPLLDKLRLKDEQTLAVEQEVKGMLGSIQAIRQRMREGVHKASLEQLEHLKQELIRVEVELEKSTVELVAPEEMFRLMRQMLFAESKLKLTALKRNAVVPVFQNDEQDARQPNIYRHMMDISFEGRYMDILGYIRRLEALEWKLLWDAIELSTQQYPVIRVDIRISTLSDDKHWVGL